MNHYPTSIQQAIKSLTRLPGIGPKTAERLVLFLLQRPTAEVETLAHNLVALKHNTSLCSRCFAFCDQPTCRICSDPARNPELLCIVESPADMLSIERSQSFTGLYHVLHGALSPMDGVGPDEIRLQELLQRVSRETVQEIIIATSTQVEGEATAAYLAQQLQGYPSKVTRIASGMPVGGDLKYMDQITLKNAMEKRHDL